MHTQVLSDKKKGKERISHDAVPYQKTMCFCKFETASERSRLHRI